MKRILLALMVASSVWAGKRITIEVVNPDTKQTSTQEILLDADRLRVNDPRMTMMFLTRGGSRVVAIDKARNEYREIDQATVQQLTGTMQALMTQMQAQMKGMTPEQRAAMEQIMGRGVAAPVATTAFTAKGPGSVSGFRCTNYDGVRAGQKIVELCAASAADLKLTASDFQVFEKLQAFVGSLTSSLQNSPLGSMIPVDNFMPQGVNGFPIQTMTYEAGKPGERRTVKSIGDAALSDADFSTGTAKKVEVNLGAGRAAKGKAK